MSDDDYDLAVELRADAIADARAEQPRKACRDCNDQGCPECWGYDDEDNE